METFVIRGSGIAYSTAEARRWADDEAFSNLPAPGDIVARFPSNAAPEIGRIGVGASVQRAEGTPATDTTAGQLR